MSYAVKEIFLTLQGEGAQSGRRAIFMRFAGCNLWSGRAQDRVSAACNFCDTDFVGTDGQNGGRYRAGELATKAAALWGEDHARRYIVLTGGEPMLQVDDALIHALKAENFEIAIESNGTLPAHGALDWVCISPKGASHIVQTAGDELKLVWPQPEPDWQAMESWDFTHFLIQPMDQGSPAANARNLADAMDFVMAHPKWRLSLQTHKQLGID